jgi:hypothetical protein
MRFAYRYYGETTVANSASSTEMRFAPDTLRPPTHFVAQINKHIPFREAMSALHEVVVADQRYQAPDKTAYKAWLAEHEAGMLADFMATEPEVRARIPALQAELNELQARKNAVLRPFYGAQQKYFDYLYKANRELWYVLDPVITVHPDCVFFECFSQDESSYASLSCSHEVFDRVGDFACGTTNIDYSESLYGEFQKIRDYKSTQLAIDPSGFQVQTADDPVFIEEKIDVPDSWVRGFLQVSSAMNMASRRLDLHPMDVHNFCLQLRRKKERSGPRSIRFVLTPGEPVRAIFEPWNDEVVCRRSIYQGSVAEEIRVWGRRRLLVLERLIAVATSFTVHLMGSGLPSFWIANLPDMQLTLGLSGWIANDWSQAGQFDLLAPRGEVDDDSKVRVLEALQKRWYASVQQLASDTGLSPVTVSSALTLYVQAGRVVFDLTKGVYRLRELAREPLPLTELRFASPLEEQAAKLLAVQALSKVSAEALDGGGLLQRADVRDGDHRYQVSLRLDADQRIADGSCQCNHYTQNRLRAGPCSHMLALRMSLTREKAAA